MLQLTPLLCHVLILVKSLPHLVVGVILNLAVELHRLLFVGRQRQLGVNSLITRHNKRN